MLERIRSFLKIFLIVNLASGIARSVMVCIHYSRYPQFYAMQSAPWYTELHVILFVTMVISLFVWLLWLCLGCILRKKARRHP